MDNHTLFSGRDALLIAIPFLLVIFFVAFGLDKRLGQSKRASDPGQRNRPCGMDANGEPIVQDPDGRQSGASRSRKDRKADQPGS